MSENQHTIKEQILNQTQHVPLSHDVLMVQPPYNLPHAEFKDIKSDSSWISKITFVFIGSSLTNLVLILSKVTAFIFGNSDKPNPIHLSQSLQGWELWALGISVFMAIVFSLSSLIPTERKRIIRKIQRHFDDNPSILEIREKK
jgi:hypothetical protein